MIRGSAETAKETRLFIQVYYPRRKVVDRFSVIMSLMSIYNCNYIFDIYTLSICNI